MGTFFVLFITVNMMYIYLITLTKSNNDVVKAQEELIKTWDYMEKEGMSRASIKSGIKAIGAILTLYYWLFFVLSAVIFNSQFATVIVSLFCVISFKNLMDAFDILDKEKATANSPFTKTFSALGFIYTTFFLIYFLAMNFKVVEVAVLLIGVGVGLLARLITIKIRKKIKN